MEKIVPLIFFDFSRAGDFFTKLILFSENWAPRRKGRICTFKTTRTPVTPIYFYQTDEIPVIYMIKAYNFSISGTFLKDIFLNFLITDVTWDKGQYQVFN